MAKPRLSFLSPRPKGQPPADRARRLVAAPPPEAGQSAGLIAALGAEACWRWQILPAGRVGGGVMVQAGAQSDLAAARAALAPFGQVFVTELPTDEIRARLQVALAPALLARAEARPPAHLSVRGAVGTGTRQGGRRGAAALVALAALVCAAPASALALMLALMTLVIAATLALRLAALLTSQLPPPLPPEDPAHDPVQWPMITLLVPLLREDAVLGALLARLAALDYPAHRVEFLLIVEEDDRRTRKMLARLTLPPVMRQVIVPRGSLQTKPRALNFALHQARGSLIGIYDAEDRPARDQLRQVARHFARAHPKVVCLQGQLDYYNARSNWMARCFTLEYAGWFRVMLPALARLGLPVPLGGTTLFLRRHALDEIGAWDAHNVTEDADLGIRIARHGYRTEVIATVTEEEANARIWPWIKQRSRWFKGYALTWAVHMRDPVALWRDLGPWGFCGMQVTLLGTLLTFLGAPLLWGFALWTLIAPLPLLPEAAVRGLGGLYLLSWATDQAVQILGARRAGKDHLIPFAPTTYAYFPLASIAAWRALIQALHDPFTWEKTEHGIYHTENKGVTADPPRPAPAGHPVSGG